MFKQESMDLFSLFGGGGYTGNPVPPPAETWVDPDGNIWTDPDGNPATTS